MKRNGKGLAWLLGESVIVVLGVLIALAADRAIQRVDEATREASVLESLLQDLQEADSVVAEAHYWAILRDSLGGNLLSVLEGQTPADIDASGLAVGIEFLPLHYTLQIPRDTWDDLLGTGQLGVVTNPAVRRAVSRFYRSAEQKVVWTEDWKRSSAAYEADMPFILPARARLDIRAAWIDGTIVDPASEAFEHVPPLDELLSRLRSWPDLEGHLSNVLLATMSAAGEYSVLRAELESVIELVQAELDAS